MTNAPRWIANSGMRAEIGLSEMETRIRQSSTYDDSCVDSLQGSSSSHCPDTSQQKTPSSVLDACRSAKNLQEPPTSSAFIIRNCGLLGPREEVSLKFLFEFPVIVDSPQSIWQAVPVLYSVMEERLLDIVSLKTSNV